MTSEQVMQKDCDIDAEPTPLDIIIAEANALDLNISALDDFIHKSPIYSGLDIDHKSLIKKQLSLMIQLYGVLVERAKIMKVTYATDC